MNFKNAEKIVNMPLEKVLLLAAEARREGVGSKIEPCSIINAKSGVCSEDCKFCAQSSHYNTEISAYSLRSCEEIVKAGHSAEKHGAKRFGIVTSGRRLSFHELELVADAVKIICKDTGISVCASLGALNKNDLVMLKQAGLSRYHHNIETSERFFPNIVTTHDYKERINTILAAKEAGLEVCSGGIFGIGESWHDRINMALLLDELGAGSIPLNFLIPIKGTPLSQADSVPPFEAIRIIALFRLMLKHADIKVVAGRETILKDFQGLIHIAGANGIMVGDYLTVPGRSREEDIALIKEVQRLWNEE
ncbi:MAG: biotin synthase BioB [Candidatus Omnitrophota bacterium]